MINLHVDVDSSYLRSVRKENGKGTCYSRNIRPIRKGLGKRSESVREEYDVILNHTNCSRCIRKGLGKDSRKKLDKCGKRSLKKYLPLLSGYSEPKYSRNIPMPMFFSVTVQLVLYCSQLIRREMPPRYFL